MPFVCKRRSDIADGVLQVTDLWPNISQRNSVLDPQGQGPLYLRDPQSDAVFTSGAGPIVTRAQYRGVAAYLIDRVEDGAGAALLAADANAIADALVALMQSGGVLDAAAVDAEIGGVVGGATLTGGTSTATLIELLQVLAGASYVLPAGTVVDTDGSTFDVTVSGSFPEGTFLPTFDTDALTISFNAGVLSQLVSPTYTFQGTSGAAAVVYNDDGTLFV